MPKHTAITFNQFTQIRFKIFHKNMTVENDSNLFKPKPVVEYINILNFYFILLDGSQNTFVILRGDFDLNFDTRFFD